MEFSLNLAQFSERYNLMAQMDSSVPSSETRASNWKIRTAELGSDHKEEGVSDGPDVNVSSNCWPGVFGLCSRSEAGNNFLN